MPVIHPPVKADARFPWHCWIATGAVVPPPADAAQRVHPPVALLFAALVIGGLIGWGLR